MKKLPTVTPQLVIQELDQEFLIFDPSTEKAHCLSGVGALVFKACREQLSLAELKLQLKTSGVTDEETAIEESLRQLGEEKLVASQSGAFNRRRFLSAAGTAAAIPLITSVMAPRPAQALSCVNCALIAPTTTPQDCTDCGKKCPAGAGCTATATCCFEYTLNPGLGAAGSGCIVSEFSGNFRCRVTAPRVFAVSCAAARDATLNGGGVFGTLYYCCSCPGAPAGQAC